MIRIVPVNNADSRLLAEIAKELDTIFRTPVLIDSLQMPVKSAYDTGRGQYSAEGLMRSLNINKGGNIRTLGITDVDLFCPGLNFVFGLADDSSLSAIVSVARFRSGHTQGSMNSRLTERALKTAIHELGHTFGLSHCRNNKCVMFFSFDLRDTDHKEKDFCRRCRKIIEKRLPLEDS